MTERLRGASRALLADESGQAMTEYVLVIVVLVMGLVTAVMATKYALFDYYGRFSFWNNLPFP